MQDYLINNLATHLQEAVQYSNSHPESKLAHLRFDLEKVYSLVKHVQQEDTTGINNTLKETSSETKVPITHTNSSISSNGSISLTNNKDQDQQQQTNTSSPNTGRAINSSASENGTSKINSSAMEINDDDANRIMQNFLIAVHKNNNESKSGSSRYENESSQEEEDDDISTSRKRARIAPRRGRASRTATSAPAASTSSAPASTPSPRVSKASPASPSKDPVIFVQFKEDRYLTHKDLTRLTRTKYPLNEALVKNYRKNTGRDAYVWAKLRHFDELSKQHPGIKRNHFQGPNKAMRLFSIEFMEFLKKSKAP